MDSLTDDSILPNPLDPSGNGRPPILVFNGKANGLMQNKTAAIAKRFYDAKPVERGHTGKAYCLMTGPSQGKHYPLRRILRGMDDLFETARRNPETYYQLPRIACGMNGRPDLEPKFARHAIAFGPENILLSGPWENRREPLARIFLYALPYISDDTAFKIFDGHLSRIRQQLPWDRIEIIIPPRDDGAQRAMAYAKSRGLRKRLIRHPIYSITKDDMLISHFIFWYATHAIFLYSNDPSKKTYHAIHTYGNLEAFAKLAYREHIVARWFDVDQAAP